MAWALRKFGELLLTAVAAKVYSRFDPPLWALIVFTVGVFTSLWFVEKSRAQPDTEKGRLRQKRLRRTAALVGAIMLALAIGVGVFGSEQNSMSSTGITVTTTETNSFDPEAGDITVPPSGFVVPSYANCIPSFWVAKIKKRTTPYYCSGQRTRVAFDPCFRYGRLQGLVCFDGPWGPKGPNGAAAPWFSYISNPKIISTVGRPSLRSGWEKPWALELEGGFLCVRIGLGDVEKKYACVKQSRDEPFSRQDAQLRITGYVTKFPNRSGEPWTVPYAIGNHLQENKATTNVAAAWR